ncbi:MAG TPA: SMP-30/gluconolactonase/LRE family protein [Blastocatellia bacterium]|nr:SMP-30/gluconolactonase/LRE family protein [Blastocatellia bacterium]
MKPCPISRTLLVSVLIATAAFSQTQTQTQENYPQSPDSKPQPGVPKGEVLQFSFDKSKIFPGTFRDYWVYVPSQYTPDKPACVYVNQDGLQYEAPVVFDNLIHKKEMPVTIGVFVMHGRVKAADPNSALDRMNRSFEYDGLGDNYVRFLLEELLPDVETKKTSDGRAIGLSKSGNDRAIGGQSSGAICAFNAAWERPDAFSRVFSAIGTYVALRGGDRFSSLARRFEPKPMRVFLQDGSNDLNIYGGDWWMANQTLERSLTFAGSEVQHVWGEGPHSGRHATALFPDAMRWLWKDWPQPVKGGQSKNATLDALLIPGEGWQLVSEGYTFTEGPAANAKGEIFFTDIPNNKIHKISLDGKVSVFNADSKRANGQAFGADGKLYVVASGEQKIVVYDPDGQQKVIAEGIAGNDIVVAHNGNVYVTNPPPNPPAAGSNDPSKVWLIKPGGEKQVVDTGLRYSNGITLSPDQTTLYVADYRSHWIYAYQVQADGTLQAKQRYGWLFVSDNDDQSNADGMRVDRDGRVYVATRMGIQVCDQLGRVQCIIPTPNGRVSNVSFGGAAADVLFATCGDKIYKRKLKVKGAHAWDAPNKPAPPRL